MPAIYLINSDGSDSLVPKDVRGEFVIVHATAREFRLRKGDNLLCLFNEAFDGLAEPHADATARSIARAEADECRSHGRYRLIGCVASVRSGKVERVALPTLSRATPTILRVDARRGFAPLAIETGALALVEATRMYGIAALAINDCYHFSTL